MLEAMPVPRFDLIADRRAIIDRRALADRLAALPGEQAPARRGADLCATRSTAGRAEIARRLAAEPGRGRAAAARHRLPARPARPPGLSISSPSGCPEPQSASGERISLVGLGGTGRGEMAPYSDLDLMFLVAPTATRRGASRSPRRCFYLLWDLKLKVGHSVRTPRRG